MSNQLLPFIEKGNKNKPVIVFLAGFPDNQTSGWGDVLPKRLEKDFRLIFLCMPEYQSGNTTYKPWGYRFDEITDMMHATLESLNVTQKKFYLVVHDWGAFLGLMYENKHPELITKMVMFDVGRLKPQNVPIKTILIILLYQWWFATAYVIAQIINRALGDIIFKIFLSKPISGRVGPCPNETLTIPFRELTVEKCYPYYQFWRAQFTMSFREPRYPSCPLLFLVSLL